MELRYEFECSDISTCKSYSLYLNPGKYKLEAWGAQGGNYSTTEGGNGAYVSGIISLFHRTKIFILVGEKGIIESSPKLTRNSFGFGGNGYYTAASGGGLTYISHDFDSPSNAWLIASGGGGASFISGCRISNKGGHAGSYIGGDGLNGFNCDLNSATAGGLGATQISPGINKDRIDLNGKQFYGGNQTLYSYYGSGGGAGYYGGAAGNWYGASGSGGSSWVSNQLTERILISGNESMPTPYLEGTATVIGNKGHGHARITHLGNIVSCDFHYYTNSSLLSLFFAFIVISE